ncbi:MAG: DUF2155 domain-containing protein [Pseudomonadota bacterium]
MIALRPILRRAWPLLGSAALVAVAAGWSTSLPSPVKAQIVTSPLEAPTANEGRIALPPPRGQRGVRLLPNGVSARDSATILQPDVGEGAASDLFDDRSADDDSAILTPPPGSEDPEISLLPTEDDVPEEGVLTPFGSPDRFRPAPFRTPAFPERDRTIRLGATTGTEFAELRVLDMLTGDTETITVARGEATPYQRLSLTLIECARPDRARGVGDIGLLQIKDTGQVTPEGDDGEVFSGWMFADSPALSALDHPRYDVWLISCSTLSEEAAAGSDQKSAEVSSDSSSSAR